MKLHTARQVVCDVTETVASNIARARRCDSVQVIKEARATIHKAHKLEQQRKKENR